jgi:uncharacterized protein YaiL (DUF2058 family)
MRTTQACISQNQPTGTKSPAGSNRNAAKEKEEKNFSFAQQPQQNLKYQQERNRQFFSRQQTNRSSSREPVAINLSPHQPHKPALVTERKMCFCGVEPQTAHDANVKEEENHLTVAGQLQILSHTLVGTRTKARVIKEAHTNQQDLSVAA